MKVHLIKTKTVYKFAEKHADSYPSLRTWLNKIKKANWQRPEDIKQTFASVDFLGRGSKRVVFDVGGNKYRIICAYKFGNRMVHLFIKWIGTHDEYDQLCNQHKQYTVEHF